ncbi:DUF732 domain-containing protein [Williamsia herbipolensis]|uniref:DUF732 domain-containing protein n=1 Tax=Williamsia herbipolensis TaxID=1603258 RepID=UPI000697DDF2|nr:DUF732 domain-containing protein [Williamsia herbipolensis]
MGSLAQAVGARERPDDDRPDQRGREMNKQWMRVLVATAGAAVTVGVAGCGSGDSTVSAPDSAVSSVATSSSAPSSAAASSGAASSTAASGAPESGSAATAPGTQTSAPAGFPGGASPAPQGSKGAAYLAELKRTGVEFPNDPDNAVAFATAEYVCSSKASNTDALQIKTYVTAFVASGTTDAAAASAKADKVIAAATSTYCK